MVWLCTWLSSKSLQLISEKFDEHSIEDTIQDLKETFDEQSTDFFEIAFIENKYIKAKRMHNINAINLYYKYENYSTKL